ncbi:hypothetical protein BFP97_14550 [Roseivirga sp. 4D4]|uniref:M56 family metallopeptidase n=1 Tax=Roseivirga sp. 4D4 TaxID=1889784 RepID=UPI0008530BFF|nr:M56 family metallopeptidase [Roseivirga sp. 4D4]OEK02667.1 hypothetical protein BFP97_14550 [Roseivirga sp. 4D4]
MEINNNLFDALGMTLIDSLWQGAIVMAIAFVGLWVMKKSKANLRHNFLLICIVALPVMGVYTFSQRYEPAATYVETTLLQDIGFISDSEASMTSAPVSTSLDIKNEAFEWVQMTPWIGVFWTVGMLLIFLRAAGGYLYLNRLKSSAFILDDIELNRLFDKLKDGFDLKREVLLKESMKISSPMVYGYFKPVILFPLGLVQGLTTDEVEVILLHELAHLKRNDFLINIVINGLRAVYFYHPVFWWLQSQLDNEREFASDEMVMEHQADGLTLVRALTKAKEFSMLSPSLGFAGSSKNQLLKRVNRIMKKQQKPNWTGLILPCLILVSVLLFTSQREKVDFKTESDLVEVDTIPKSDGLGPFLLDLNPSEGDNLNQESVNSPFTTSWSHHPQKVSELMADSITVMQATMELLEDPSPISVTVSMGDGAPIYFYKNGRMIKGDEFKVYEKAYLKLYKYSSKASTRNQHSFMGGNGQLDEQLVRMRGFDFSGTDSELNVKELDRLVNEWAEETVLRDKMIMDLTKSKNPSIDEIKAVPKQVEKVANLEDEIARFTEVMTPEQKEVFYKRQEVVEKQKQLQGQAELIELEKELAQATRQLQSKLSVEQQKLDQMILKLTSDPENTDPKAVNDQVIMVDRLKKELSAYPTNAEKYIDYQKSLEEARDRQQVRNNEIFQKEQELVALRDDLIANEQKIFQGTSYSEDGKSIEFHLGSEGFEFAKNLYESDQESGTKPIIEVDGKLRPDLKFSDFKQENIASIQIFKGRAQQKRYPNGETKGYNGIISIITVANMDVLINPSGQQEERLFSKKRTVYGFSEDEGGQRYATQVITDARAAYDNSVIVFNGKFMPDNWLVKYDKWIKTIKVIRGEALKKFPKRKVKSYDTVIEISTRK